MGAFEDGTVDPLSFATGRIRWRGTGTGRRIPSQTNSRVSAIVVAHNGERFLADALRSVSAQTRAIDEVIVVDDGSTDTTAAIAAAFPDVLLVTQERSGPAAARNRGVKEATGDVIAFLDCDDLWLPGKTAEQLEAMQRTGAGLVSGHALVQDEVRAREWPDLSGLDLTPGETDRLVLGNRVGNPSRVMVRRDVFEQAGGFDPELPYAEDWDLWLRMAELTRFTHVPKTVIRYRWHLANLSHRTRDVQAECNRRVARQALGRVEGPMTRLRLRRAIAARYQLEQAEALRAAGRRPAARIHAIGAITLDPVHDLRRKGAVVWRGAPRMQQAPTDQMGGTTKPAVERPSAEREPPVAGRGPTVSAIVLAYNGERYLDSAIQSVLNQTRRPDEIIVLDNGSTDRTAEIARSYEGVRCITLPENVGAAAGYNRGAAEATGDLIAFLDYDDEWLPEKTALQWAVFADQPATAVVSGRMIFVDEISGRSFVTESVGPVRQPFPRSLVHKNHVGNMSVAMVRRSSFLRNGGMDPAHPWADDWHLWLLIIGSEPIRFVEAPLIRYRWHASNLSHDRIRDALRANEKVAVAGMRRLLPWWSWPVTRARIRSWHRLQLSHTAAEEGRALESARVALVSLLVFPFSDVRPKLGNIYRGVTRRRKRPAA